MILYLDSNALAKLYLNEDAAEQQQVLALLKRHERIASCAIAFAEVGSVFARYFYKGVLDEDAYADKMQRFVDDWASVNVVDIVPATSTLAAQLMKAHAGLRAMDALHLASALALRQSASVKLLTFDLRLQAAAQALMPDAFA